MLINHHVPCQNIRIQCSDANCTYLLQDCVIWTINTQFPDLMVVSHNEKRLFSWNEYHLVSETWWDLQLLTENLHSESQESRLTRQSFACIRVSLQGFIAIHTQALVGAISVDTSLATRKGSGAFVNIHTGLSIILQVETRPTFTLITKQKHKRWLGFVFCECWRCEVTALV